MRNISATAVALGTSFKQQCINNGLDVQVAAPRFVAERFLAHWRAGMGPAPYMVKGGLMCPQSMRSTMDADIVSVRRYTNLEVQRGFRIISGLLEAEGITIKRIPEAKEIDIGYGDPVARYKIEAMCGTLRGNFGLDVSTARGPYAFPAEVPLQDLPKLFENDKSGKWPVLRARAQPFEASAAEKWLAVLMQDAGDFRVKHLADLLSFDQMSLDVQRVGEEILRVARHRGIPLSVCAPSPAAIEWRNMKHREESWSKLSAERGFAMTYDQAFIDINGYWSDTHQALTQAIVRDFRRPSVGQPIINRINRVIAFEKPPETIYKPF